MAAKDCPSCVRRRIQCDRGLPNCRKCDRRNIQCPGYGLILKWDQGVASRGKMMGRCVPVSNAESKEPTRGFLQPTCRTREHTGSIQGLSHRVWANANTTLSSPLPLARSLSISGKFEKYHVAPLLIHFEQEVAPRLVWVDNRENPWLKYVLPLALVSDSVFWSILALASECLARRYAQTWSSVTFQKASDIYRELALNLVTKALASEVQNGPDASLNPGHHGNSILATILVLCHVEVRRSESTIWRLHLGAAHTVIRRRSKSTCIPNPTDHTDEILLQEFFAMNVWTFLTTFDDYENMIDITLVNDGNTIFMEFLRVIHAITSAERHLYLYQSSHISDFGELYEALLTAKNRTYALSSHLRYRNACDEGDFGNLIEAYHQAGVLYAYRALGLVGDPVFDIKLCKTAIVDHLSSLVRLDLLVQDLVWPLFILGAESWGDITRQTFVERMLIRVIQRSGSMDRYRVLSFLTSFWASDGVATWIQFARSHKAGKNFLIL